MKLKVLAHREFQKIDVLTADCDSCSDYMKNTREVIRSQIMTISSSDFIVETENTFLLCHPMSAQIRVNICSAVEHFAKTTLNPSIIWKEAITNKVQSAVYPILPYSDRTQTTMSAESDSWYSIHVTLLNFMERTRRTNLSSGSHIAAHLPVNYLRGKMELQLAENCVLRIACLHSYISYVRNQLAICTLNGSLLQHLWLAFLFAASYDHIKRYRPFWVWRSAQRKTRQPNRYASAHVRIQTEESCSPYNGSEKVSVQNKVFLKSSRFLAERR